MQSNIIYQLKTKDLVGNIDPPKEFFLPCGDFDDLRYMSLEAHHPVIPSNGFHSLCHASNEKELGHYLEEYHEDDLTSLPYELQQCVREVKEELAFAKMSSGSATNIPTPSLSKLYHFLNNIREHSGKDDADIMLFLQNMKIDPTSEFPCPVFNH